MFDKGGVRLNCHLSVGLKEAGGTYLSADIFSLVLIVEGLHAELKLLNEIFLGVLA